jgi:glycosyltransferase involved in cell wall biosynthesis
MKILLLTDGIFPFVMGGMQKHSYYLAKYLEKEGVDVTLAHCVYAPNQLPKTDEVLQKTGLIISQINGFNFPTSSAFPGHYLYNSWRYSQLLWKYYQSTIHQYDLVYAQGFTAWAWNQDKVKAPIVVNLHGLEMFQTPYSNHDKLEKFLLQIPAKSILKNARFAQSLGGHLTSLVRPFNSNVFDCGIGIADSWYRNELNSGANNKPIKFVFVGRYEYRKGLDVLSEAILPLLDKHSFSIDFIGPIPEHKQLKNHQLKYWGSVSDESQIQSILDTADVLLVPSRSEGMPTVILEAMARGLAVIATDVGAVKDLVSPENGSLIQAGQVYELKTAMLSYINGDSETLMSQKRASQAKVKSYLWSQMIQQYIQHFNKFLTA